MKDRGLLTFGSRCAEAALALLYPPRCLTCGGADEAALGAGSLICDTCREKMFVVDRPKCQRCAAPLAEQLAGGPHCPWCRRAKFRFERVVALGVYRDLLREAVLRIKHPRQEALALTLGKMLGRQVRQELPERQFDLVVPMPMSLGRRIVQGVNGPELLAEAVSRALRSPVKHALVVKRRHPKQSLLPASERPANVRGAYGVPPWRRLEGKAVLLVDDTLTTGSTANEASRALRQAGAASVVVAVVARAVGAA